jgi:hypothetical protein
VDICGIARQELEQVISFEPIAAVARVMAGFPRPWFVSGGWAIDLFVGRATREHEDREVGLFRRDQAALHEHLSGWEREKVVFGSEGAAWASWERGERIELPLFQLRARRQGGEPGEIEFFLNDAEGDEWICRRDARITRPVGEISGRSGSGIPFLAPEIQLLYKAKWHREKDEHDFTVALGRMSPAQRAWLKARLELIHPGDPWLAALECPP